jgi:hypothetical protein
VIKANAPVLIAAVRIAASKSVLDRIGQSPLSG